MKKLILTGLSLLFAVTLTFAQDANPEQKAQEAITQLTQNLSLTQEQQTSIYPIILDKVKAKHALKEDKTLSPEALKTQIEALSQAADEKIVALLTEDQKPIYKEWAKEKHTKKAAPIEPAKQDTSKNK